MMMPLVAHLHAIYSSAALPGHPGLRGVYVFTSIVTLEKTLVTVTVHTTINSLKDYSFVPPF